MIKRPWGGYIILEKRNNFWLKKLYVDSRARLSLQSHQYRQEVWYVLKGEIIAQIGSKKVRGKPGDFFIVSLNKKHRIQAVKQAIILEFAFGKVLETDIVRYEDDYHRKTV